MQSGTRCGAEWCTFICIARWRFEASHAASTQSFLMGKRLQIVVPAISIVIGCDDNNYNRWITLLVKYIRLWQSEMSRRKPPKAITWFAPNLLQTVSHRVFAQILMRAWPASFRIVPALKHFQLKIFKWCSRLWVTARNMDIVMCIHYFNVYVL